MTPTVRTRILSTLLTPLIAGTVLTVLAPLGSHTFPLGYRALYWCGLCLAGGLGATAAQAAFRRWRPNVAIWLRTLIQSAAATLAVAPFVMIGTGPANLLGVLLTLFYIWVIAIVITAVAELAGRRDAAPGPATGSATEVATEAARPALMDKLPLHMRSATLFGVVSEDHYVRIHTSAGDHMLLMRLADVAALAQPLSGLSPHRSWWVAEDGVAEIARVSGKTVIRLKDGTAVPVSRAGAARMREQGW